MLVRGAGNVAACCGGYAMAPAARQCLADDMLLYLADEAFTVLVCEQTSQVPRGPMPLPHALQLCMEPESLAAGFVVDMPPLTANQISGEKFGGLIMELHGAVGDVALMQP